MAMGLIIKVANNFIELLQCAGHSFNAGKTGQANTSTMLIVQERGGGVSQPEEKPHSCHPAVSL